MEVDRGIMACDDHGSLLNKVSVLVYFYYTLYKPYSKSNIVYSNYIMMYYDVIVLKSSINRDNLDKCFHILYTRDNESILFCMVTSGPNATRILDSLG